MTTPTTGTITRYIVGQVVELATVVTVDGTPAPPGGITLTITPVTAAGTPTVVTAAGLTNPGPGEYTYAYAVPAAGHYRWSWVTTGAGAGVSTGWFDAVDQTPPLITLADARDAINRSDRPMNARDTAELQQFVDAVNSWIHRRCGPVVPQTVTETVTPLFPAGGPVLRVKGNVLVVQSATVYGQAVVVTDWSGARGRIAAGPYSYLPVGTGVTVTYVAGYSPVPPDLVTAARLLLQHMWRTQRSTSVAPDTSGDDVTVGGFGYAIPNRVATLVEPYELGPAAA